MGHHGNSGKEINNRRNNYRITTLSYGFPQYYYRFFIWYNTSFMEAHSVLRSRAASTIWKLRRLEASPHPYNTERGLSTYIHRLNGLDRTIDYLQTLKSCTVLDIGAGRCMAIEELALDRGLSAIATGLRPLRHSDKSWLKDIITYKITPAETLRGIQDSTVGAILAVRSISYSSAPQLVAASMNRVLVPGGVIKGCFPYQDEIYGEELPIIEHSMHGIARELCRLGFCVHKSARVLTAVKPGNPQSLTAKEIFERDYYDYVSKYTNK